MTSSKLGEALDRIRDAMPSLEEQAQRLVLAIEVMHKILGPDWLAAHNIDEDPLSYLRD